MRAGRLNRRVTLQVDSHPRGSMGSSEPVWTDVATVWGSVEPIRGREFFDAEKITSEVTTRIRIRFRRDVRSHWRVRELDVGGDRMYEILAVIRPFDGRQELQLMSRELGEGEPNK